MSQLVKELREHIEEMDEDERVEFFSELTEGYCLSCGRDEFPCHCENDE